MKIASYSLVGNHMGQYEFKVFFDFPKKLLFFITF